MGALILVISSRQTINVQHLSLLDPLQRIQSDVTTVTGIEPLLGPRIAPRPMRLWIPRKVLVTPAALEWEHGRGIVDRAEALGSEIVRLKSNRLTGISDKKQNSDPRRAYADAKTTLAVVVSPAGKRKLQPIPPSADWQFHLAEGCPAHCQYCYLAGSLPGPPITRVYANLPEILAGLCPYEGQGTITSHSEARSNEGSTFEASCYTDPLGIEHLSGSLAETIRFFGAWNAPVQLRFTTKFDAVDSLLRIAHSRRTRIRFSVNASQIVRDFEGGTASLSARLHAMSRVAQVGYPVGLTIAPIFPFDGWQEGYTNLLESVGDVLSGIPDLDLSAEMITHRFTPGSKNILLNWYPKIKLEMDEAKRTRKLNKFGTFKYVYPKQTMAELRAFFGDALKRILPQAKALYWT